MPKYIYLKKEEKTRKIGLLFKKLQMFQVVKLSLIILKLIIFQFNQKTMKKEFNLNWIFWKQKNRTKFLQNKPKFGI